MRSELQLIVWCCSVILPPGGHQHVRLWRPSLHPHPRASAAQEAQVVASVIRLAPAVPRMDASGPLLLPLQRLPSRRPPHAARARVQGVRSPSILGESPTAVDAHDTHGARCSSMCSSHGSSRPAGSRTGTCGACGCRGEEATCSFVTGSEIATARLGGWFARSRHRGRSIASHLDRDDSSMFTRFYIDRACQRLARNRNRSTLPECPLGRE